MSKLIDKLHIHIKKYCAAIWKRERLSSSVIWWIRLVLKLSLKIPREVDVEFKNSNVLSLFFKIYSWKFKKQTKIFKYQMQNIMKTRAISMWADISTAMKQL